MQGNIDGLKQTQLETDMKKNIILICLFLLLTPSLLLAADETALRSEAGRLVKTYVGKLKGALQTSMTMGGPVRAIDTCKKQAPKFAAEMEAASGWQIGRTSLRIRNPANRPDAWERAGLETFEQQHRAGTPAGKLVKSEIVQQGAQQRFRFLKAIPTGKLCLTCHGDNIAPEIRQALQRDYPQDQATGFKIGDLRGAFTLSKPLD